MRAGDAPVDPLQRLLHERTRPEEDRGEELRLGGDARRLRRVGGVPERGDENARLARARDLREVGGEHLLLEREHAGTRRIVDRVVDDVVERLVRKTRLDLFGLHLVVFRDDLRLRIELADAVHERLHLLGALLGKRRERRRDLPERRHVHLLHELLDLDGTHRTEFLAKCGLERLGHHLADVLHRANDEIPQLRHHRVAKRARVVEEPAERVDVLEDRDADRLG